MCWLKEWTLDNYQMICWMKEADICIYLCVILFKWSWLTDRTNLWWSRWEHWLPLVGPTSVLEMCGDYIHGNLLSCMFKICMLYCILYLHFWREVAQPCPLFCDPMDCSLPGSSIHGILQARIVEWAAISCSKGSSWPRDQTRVSDTAGRLLTVWATRGSCILIIQNKVL